VRGLRRFTITTTLLLAALLPMIAAVSPEAAPAKPESRIPVAIAQPLSSAETTAIVAVPQRNGSRPALPESGMLVLVGSALIGLAALVRAQSQKSNVKGQR
jgi:hypothetical protein